MAETGKRKNRKPHLNRMRRRRHLHTLWLCGVLLLIVVGIAVCLLLTGRQKTDSLEISYEVLEEFSISGSAGRQIAEGYAADLCVGETTVELEGITLDTTEYAALFDLDDGTTLYAQNMYDRLYPASITKIMTGLLALEYGNMDETVIISASALDLESGSQVCGFAEGDKVSMRTLVNCLLVYSGNDAAAAIAEAIGGTEDAFVAMMNEKAESLGMTGTHFTNPHGLQDEDHYTTVYDIYLMLNEARKNSDFLSIIGQDSYTANYENAGGESVSVSLTATDQFLTGQAMTPKNVTILGGKTGTTSQAGHCLALLSQNMYGSPYICIITNASTEELLYEQMSLLLATTNV